MFDASEYNENIAVCEYVWELNNIHDLCLEDSYDIQRVANMYCDKLQIDSSSEDFKRKDSLVLKLAKRYVREEVSKRNRVTDIDIRNQEILERLTSSHGGYGFSEEYDDLGKDEIVELKLK